jgi:hypothetical protein
MAAGLFAREALTMVSAWVVVGSMMVDEERKPRPDGRG